MPPKKPAAGEKKPPKEITATDKAVEFIMAYDLPALEKLLEEQRVAQAKSINKLDQKWGKTALFCAAEEGRMDMLMLLIDYKAKVNSWTRDRRTPIMGAAHMAEDGIIEFLVAEHSADVTIASNDGETAMHIAARRGHLSTCQLLHAKGCAVDTVSVALETPLGSALKMMHFKVSEGHVNFSMPVKGRIYRNGKS